jgi:phage shock protein A
MSIFKRVSDILTANLNEMIDCFEDPEAMLRQAIREMEQAVSDSMEAAAKAIAQERLLARRLEEHRRRSDLLRERAADAIRRGDDGAARATLAARSRQEKLIAALGEQHAAAAAQSSRLRTQIEGLQVRLSEARQRMHVAIARHRAAEARQQLAAGRIAAVPSAHAFERFEHLCSRIEQQEAEADAWAELAGEETLFEHQAPDLDIELELQAIRHEIAEREKQE